jgi:hypothetical protein
MAQSRCFFITIVSQCCLVIFASKNMVKSTSMDKTSVFEQDLVLEDVGGDF